MRVLTIIPTYNEIESLPLTLGRLRDAVPESDVLVVDDASPDGTGDWADARAAEDPSVHVLHRTTKDGLGGAYIAGFRWGLERGYDVLVEMDADGSHQPEQLPRLLEAVRIADLVIGSRRVPGGKMVNWPTSRKMISWAGSLYPRIMLGLNLTDITAGYRAYRADTLRAIDLDAIDAKGYAFQIETTYRALRKGFDSVVYFYGPGSMNAIATRGFPTTGDSAFPGEQNINNTLQTFMDEGGTVFSY